MNKPAPASSVDLDAGPARKPHGLRWRVWSLAALALMLAALAVFWMLRPAPVEVEVARVQRAALKVWVEEEARSRVRERHGVHAPVSGLLQRIAYREGDRVAQGAVVARIAPALPSALDVRSLRTQQAAVAAAQAAVTGAQARLSRAQAAADQAHIDLARTQALAQQGFISPSLVESQGLAQTSALRERDAQQAALEAARQDLARLQAGLIEPTEPAGPARPHVEVRAPISGVVLKRLAIDQSPVQAGTLLLDLGDLQGMEIIADLLTTQATQVQTGQAVELFDWGRADLLQAEVERIEPGAFTKVSALGVEEQRVRVVMRLQPASIGVVQGLGDGWRLQARIQIRSLQQTLQIPVAAVFPMPAREGSHAASNAGSAAGAGVAGAQALGVYLLENGRARLRPIEVLDRSATHIAVGHGLQEGDAVVLYPPARLREGDRLRIER